MFDPERIDMIMALRGRGISDNSVLRGMELIARKIFVPEALRDKAYGDQSLPIECGQSISAPFHIAMMTQVLELSKEHKLLEIGLGSGYHAAVMSRTVTRVYAVERYNSLIDSAEARFKLAGVHNVVSRHGDGRYGWPGQAPFDRIMLSCGVRAVPDMLLDQLAPNGVLVGSVDGQLTVVRKARVRMETQTIMPLTLPMIEAGKSKTL
ncbi:protein-L-isoaspartate(D-aspartate) O-methyltransferase [Fretibacter rubidus]|uniref:protein-L-isoaspartate(D-aspartate) O-methyltransferase n=1 Tax=Fretibacter rubidus TaxID=570162 RepID=UPI00352B79CA